MPLTKTYECDKCHKTETVYLLWNGLDSGVKEGWLILTVDARSIMAGQLPSTYAVRKEVGCLCKECAEKLGWVGEKAEPITFEDLIREIVQEEMGQ